MAELRLEDIVGFFVAGGILLLIGLAGVLLYVLWPQIRLFVGALGARHFNGDWWTDTLEWIADQRESPYTSADANDRIMSGDDARGTGSALLRTGTQGGSDERFYGTRTTPVQHLAEVTFDDVCDFLLDHNLTDEEGVDLLALAKRKSGYFLSANNIRDRVGGSDAEVKARVRKWRGEPIPAKAPAKAEPPVSPIAGRPYDPKQFHSDNPELQYVEP